MKEENKLLYHIPALLNESIEGLNIKPSGIYVDITFGGGGHSKEILKRLNKDGKLFVFDKDIESKKNLTNDSRVRFTHSDYKYFSKYLKIYGINKVNGILGDFGVSFHQFDKKERGFSLRFDSKLDMRMDKNQEFSAYNVINEYKKEDLENIFKLYGEIANYKKITENILNYRDREDKNIINTTQELIKLIEPDTPKFNTHKYLAKVFQAIRIEVNNELESIKDFLYECTDILEKEGRLCIISYHSLEDRLVKNFFKTGNVDGIENKDFFGNIYTPFKLVTRKPIIPNDNDIKMNSRSRSAKLRICEKK